MRKCRLVSYFLVSIGFDDLRGINETLARKKYSMVTIVVLLILIIIDRYTGFCKQLYVINVRTKFLNLH